MAYTTGLAASAVSTYRDVPPPVNVREGGFNSTLLGVRKMLEEAHNIVSRLEESVGRAPAPPQNAAAVEAVGPMSTERLIGDVQRTVADLVDRLQRHETLF